MASFSFCCFQGVMAPPKAHKENATFLYTLLLNSDDILSRFRGGDESFRDKMTKLFSNADDAVKIHRAIDKLYQILLKCPDVSQTAEAIMQSARSSVSLDVVADEDEMIELRDLWLRRVDNASTLMMSRTLSTPFSGDSGKGFITIPIFFATNRNAVGGTVKKFYGTSRADKVSWGVMWLSLPDSLGYGKTDSLSWRFSKKRTGVERKKIVQLAAIPLDETCVNNLGDIVKGAGESECTLFVHGYNTTLSNACKRMAQVAYTGNFRGPSFVFSWPSNQATALYAGDEANVMWAIPDFLKTLQYLRQNLGVKKIHLMGHSMGSRLIIYSLLRLPSDTNEAPDLAKIGQLVLAAPDFDMGEFLNLVDEVNAKCEKVTVYCSRDDQALRLSRRLHGGYPRLGDIAGFHEMADSPRITGLQKIDAVDTTGIDNSWFRHTYVFDTCGVIADCCVILKKGYAPQHRKRLVARSLTAEVTYWAFELSGLDSQVSSMLMSAKFIAMSGLDSSEDGLPAGALGPTLSGVTSDLGKALELIEEEEELRGDEIKRSNSVLRPLLSKRFMDTFAAAEDLDLGADVLNVVPEEASMDGGSDVKVVPKPTKHREKHLSRAKSMAVVGSKKGEQGQSSATVEFQLFTRRLKDGVTKRDSHSAIF